MSDSSFDDDDDMLMELVRATQHPPNAPNAPVTTNTAAIAPSADLAALFNARGEIAILRAQLEAAQAQGAAEAARLLREMAASTSAAQGQVAALRQSVDKLEDEKRFLDNEIRAMAKRRRTATGATTAIWPDAATRGAGITTGTTAGAPVGTTATTPGITTGISNGSPGAIPGISATGNTATDITVATNMAMVPADDWSQLCDHLYRYTINGSARTSWEVLQGVELAAVTLTTESSEADREMAAGDAPRGLSPGPGPGLGATAALWDYLLRHRHQHLDALVDGWCRHVLALAAALVARGAWVAPPFLVSLVHAAASFNAAAVRPPAADHLVRRAGALARHLLRVLADADADRPAPPQHCLLQRLTLVACLDLVETAVVAASYAGDTAVRHLWTAGALDPGLVADILPENSERFKTGAQINLVYSLVQLLSASVGAGTFASPDPDFNARVVKSLLKAFLIDIALRPGFLFYGLNRSLGNNSDWAQVDVAVPAPLRNPLRAPVVSAAFPVAAPALTPRECHARALAHEHHLLALRGRMVALLEQLVVGGHMALVNLKENIKAMVRIIGFEQNMMMHHPRSPHVHMRLALIAVFLRILYYIIDDNKDINALIYPETLHEIFVILMRVAFGADLLSLEAHALLSAVRAKGLTAVAVFNGACEMRSREMAHFSLYDARPNKFADLSGIECDFANGVEFPYDLETVELAREILGVCVNHDEADNLYSNMNDS